MQSDIKKRIYKAQCIGNIEPIEYMMPYPSMRSLIEGQVINNSKRIVNKKENIDYSKFHCLIQQCANWLTDKNYIYKERIILPKLNSFQTEVLIYAIWEIGAIAVISKTSISKNLMKIHGIKEISLGENDLFHTIKTYPKMYNPQYKPLLSDEAILTFEKGPGIRLSHYNLLINVNGIDKAIRASEAESYYCDLKVDTIDWVIFKAILPIYSNLMTIDENPDIKIGNLNADFNIRYDLKNYNTFKGNDIAMCVENSGAIAVGRQPIHLTSFKIKEKHLKLNGHSVMMGYLDAKLNTKVFKDNSLYVPI